MDCFQSFFQDWLTSFNKKKSLICNFLVYFGIYMLNYLQNHEKGIYILRRFNSCRWGFNIYSVKIYDISGHRIYQDHRFKAVQ